MAETGIEIQVFGPKDPNTLIDTLNGRISPSYMENLNAPGAGNLTMLVNDPKLIVNPSLLAYRNTLKVKVAGQIVGAFQIQKKTSTIIDDTPDGEGIAVSGESIRTWTHDAEVYPEGTLKLTSFGSRFFTFASAEGAWYNSGSWVEPTQVELWGDVVNSPWRYAPGDWPDVPNAQWVWSTNSITSAPAGDNFFRYEFTSTIDALTYSLFLAADDQFVVYIDGQLITQSDPTTVAWTEVTRVDQVLDAGPHVIGIRATNSIASTPAGLLAALFYAGDPAVPSASVLVSYTGMNLTSATADKAMADANTATALAAYTALSPTDPGKANALLVYNVAAASSTQAAANVTALTAHNVSGWLVNGYPNPVPGWSPGEIVLQLLSEAQTRGVLFPTWLTPTFTATHDTYGVAWDTSLDWDFDLGSDYESVIEKLEELTCDLWVDASALTINMAAQRGVDRSVFVYDGSGNATVTAVVFEKGKNLGASSIDGVAEIANALLVSTTDGWLEIDDADTTSLDAYGRIESLLDTGASQTVSEAVAEVVFVHKDSPEEGASYAIFPTGNNDVPFVHFNVGDWVLAPNDVGLLVKRRVMSIAVEEGDSGKPLYTLEFDTIFQDDDTKINAWLQKLGGGSLGGQFANSGGGTASPIGVPTVTTPQPPALKTPLAPATLTASSSGLWSIDGVTANSQVVLTWAAVTGNTDGSATVPSLYEVWGKLTTLSNSAYARLATTSATTATLSPFQTGSDWTFEVRAVNGASQTGPFSPTVDQVMVAPSTAMVAPSTPAVTSSKGVLIITWDGLLTGSVSPPPQFRYLYAMISTSSGGTYTRMGTTLARGGGALLVSGLTIGTTYYVKLVAVDGLGVASALSSAASTTLVGVDIGDLTTAVTAAIAAANAAALAAQGTDNLLADASFEEGDDLAWSRQTSNVTKVATTPRTGNTSLSIKATSAAYTASIYQNAIPVDDNQYFYFSAWMRALGSGSTVENGVIIGILYGPDAAHLTAANVSGSPAGLASTYTLVNGTWIAPTGTRVIFPYIATLADTGNTNTYLVDDMTLRTQIPGALIIDGTITAADLSAGSVTASAIAANSIAANMMQANSVVAAAIQAGAITGTKIAANTIEGNNIDAGTITVLNLASNVGQALNISSNSSVNILAGNIATLTTGLGATNTNLDTMQTYYQFGSTGALITSPTSPFSVLISSSQISILQLSVPVSYWNSGQMYVNSLIASEIVLGNHKITKYGTGTVIYSL